MMNKGAERNLYAQVSNFDLKSTEQPTSQPNQSANQWIEMKMLNGKFKHDKKQKLIAKFVRLRSEKKVKTEHKSNFRRAKSSTE